MHPLPIWRGDLAANFIDILLLPRLPFGWRRAIADLITAYDQNLRIRPRLKQFRQRPHEYVIPAVRFKIAVHKCYDLIFSRQNAAILQRKRGLRIGPHRIGVYSVMNNGNDVPPTFRKSIGLKTGGADTQIRYSTMHHIVQILQPQANTIAFRICLGKPRIEPDIVVAVGIVELTIKADACGRPKVPQKHRLAPSRVRNDDIRRKPFVAQLPGTSETAFCPQ